MLIETLVEEGEPQEKTTMGNIKKINLISLHQKEIQHKNRRKKRGGIGRQGEVKKWTKIKR